MEITRPNQVWAMDITYIPMARGFVYLAVVLAILHPVEGAARGRGSRCGGNGAAQPDDRP
jgi:hypothetical protein